ncbi:CHAD domain-containing protein [Frankia sp. AiPs1]|uniref:CYTH and CHAD domain-containing protein n=1 Tax=Frankia sp. AiPa1 TaxID=573492 RepID=UPI00202B1774|nr:CHAD domain-containing protein [Frankia sp. AiPa1]MCL9760474.1 CYTH and CHAD domain-containing protein [Frankia sp. AiPa1]
MTVTHEVEHTFAVDETFRVPAFDTVDGVASVGEQAQVELDAVYYDTDDLRLARNQLTLRRGEGGSDAGWHLNLSTADGAREEIGRPLDAADSGGPGPRVPDDLADLVAVWVRGASLRPVVRVSIVRRTRRLRDAAGHDLLKVADDHVQARTMGRPPTGSRRIVVSRWREIDVEALDPAGHDLLVTADHILRDAGARVAVGASTLRRALAVDVGPPDLPVAAALSGPAAPSSPVAGPARRAQGELSAGQVVHAYLARNTAALLAADPAVRLGASESVHDLRVAVRRLRSTVRTFRPLFERDRATRIERGLREIGEMLGRPRDAEVQLAGLRDALDAQPGELVLGPVAARIQETLLGEMMRAREEALVFLRGERYLVFIDELLAFVSDVGASAVGGSAVGVGVGGGDVGGAGAGAGDWHGRSERGAGMTGLAGAPACRVLPKLVRRADRRLTRRVRAARSAAPGPGRDVAYHRARKAAKRLRYASEVMVPLAGKAAQRLASRARRVQEQLGAHQDSVVALGRLRVLAVAAHRAGESSFTYGLLAEQERNRAAALRRDFARRWAKASRPGIRRWLSS